MDLFLSDHYDVQSANTIIEGKCIVHSFKNYTKLEIFQSATGAFMPDALTEWLFRERERFQQREEKKYKGFSVYKLAAHAKNSTTDEIDLKMKLCLDIHLHFVSFLS
ncbi:chromatin remodeling protein EBS-like [Senna tora]|uniref:Chromatin remodeling protein EBS-like n=1 Tax=Senna tora TaxID=362788 RepID=A0A835CBB7_9FABA|nr:chromatin remodeling protein EBS-like [Senna tora]